MTSDSPSSESDALAFGNSFKVAMQAFMMKASGVRLMPFSFAGPFSSWRFASSSVISARSCCVTWGRLIQLACKRGPEIFWMRVSGCVSISPNFAKSMTGTCGNAGAAGAALSPVSIALTMP
jgi:hypothetical protein